MANRIVLSQPPRMADQAAQDYLVRLVGDLQRALDDLAEIPRANIQVSGVTAPTTFVASSATTLQTANFVGAVYQAFTKAGKLS